MKTSPPLMMTKKKKIMISVPEAEKIILQDIVLFPEIERALEEALGCVLREDICADRDQPPAHRVAMDGIGIQFSSWEQGQRRFRIEGTQKAGIAALSLTDNNSCLEVMTGAVLPNGCDCVIPVEDIQTHEGSAELQNGLSLKHMQNVHPRAKDYKKGQVLLNKGEILSAQHIAVAAAVGKATLKVAASPKVAVIGTGDELVEVDKPVEVYQVRRSNTYAVEAILKANGFPHVSRFHIQDNKEQLHTALTYILNEFDILILSGGVSMGKFDFVPSVLKDLGVAVSFHKIKQRPGKPFWYGRAKDKKAVFALPGNPVSTQMCTYRYVLPYLQEAAGTKESLRETAILSKPIEAKKDLTYFIPVEVSFNAHAQLTATPIAHRGSGDYASLTHAQGFIELPGEEKKTFKAGSTVKFFRW